MARKKPLTSKYLDFKLYLKRTYCREKELRAPLLAKCCLFFRGGQRRWRRRRRNKFLPTQFFFSVPGNFQKIKFGSSQSISSKIIEIGAILAIFEAFEVLEIHMPLFREFSWSSRDLCQSDYDSHTSRDDRLNSWKVACWWNGLNWMNWLSWVTELTELIELVEANE